MPANPVSRIAYYLAIIGGVLLVIFGLLDLIGASLGSLGIVGARYFTLGFAFEGIITIACGVIAVLGAKSASNLLWAIILIIVGLIGGGLGGLLVLLGGILGLVTNLIKKA